ncbi:hypothetical protein, partial [Stenotrophomonas maltophilia]|uniref:hypothetical protein n=1 Tax=Stenotrophomonas maltophilia TaxID=40324 RepID=UPI00313D1C20
FCFPQVGGIPVRVFLVSFYGGGAGGLAFFLVNFVFVVLLVGGFLFGFGEYPRFWLFWWTSGGGCKCVGWH